MHPDTPVTATEDDEQYAIECEVATMDFVRKNAHSVKFSKIFAYERPGSEFSTRAGAYYMLLEGFYGNTLQDTQFDMYQLPEATQEYIITQWTTIQSELVTIVYPKIGSIFTISETGEPIIGRLYTASSDGLKRHGPFSNTAEYFHAIAEAGLIRASLSEQDTITFARLGAFAFMDIIDNIELFKSNESCLLLNHMDLDTQNILVDDSFHFLAIIDREFAQTAPWEVNHFPMPFLLLWSDEKIDIALKDPGDRAHKTVSQQAATRQLYISGNSRMPRESSKRGDNVLDDLFSVY